jgi:hypothetical protein
LLINLFRLESSLLHALRPLLRVLSFAEIKIAILPLYIGRFQRYSTVGRKA